VPFLVAPESEREANNYLFSVIYIMELGHSENALCTKKFWFVTRLERSRYITALWSRSEGLFWKSNMTAILCAKSPKGLVRSLDRRNDAAPNHVSNFGPLFLCAQCSGTEPLRAMCLLIRIHFIALMQKCFML
jgi:hypothetical protein